jgi:hypothetical protein
LKDEEEKEKCVVCLWEGRDWRDWEGGGEIGEFWLKEWVEWDWVDREGLEREGVDREEAGEWGWVEKEGFWLFWLECERIEGMWYWSWWLGFIGNEKMRDWIIWRSSEYEKMRKMGEILKLQIWLECEI